MKRWRLEQIDRLNWINSQTYRQTEIDKYIDENKYKKTL